MKRLLLIAFSIYITLSIACKGDSDKLVDKAVTEYVSLLKANKYPKYEVIPKFGKEAISKLLEHADDNQVIQNFPIPSLSSVFYKEQKVGIIILYTVESIRLQRELGASSRPFVIDSIAPSRLVDLEELLPYYKAWWSKNKDKNPDELKNISPLEGTTLKW